MTWSQTSVNGGSVSFSLLSCSLIEPDFVQNGTSPQDGSPQRSCSVTATGNINGTVSITGAYSGDVDNAVSSGAGPVTVGIVSSPPAPPTYNVCEVPSTFSDCRTSFVEFTNAGAMVNATVKLSASDMPTIITNATSTLRYSNTTLSIPNWITVETNVPITYMVTMTNGTMLSGTVTVTEPWSIYNVNV